MAVGFILDTLPSLQVGLLQQSTWAFNTLMKARNIDQHDTLSHIYHLLSTQLTGLTSVYRDLLPCSFAPGGSPQAFWNWYTKWAKLKLAFHTAQHCIAAVKRVTPLYIFDNTTLDTSTVVFRVWLE
eukprot:329308-Rhodomonas_salina.2